MIGRRSTSRAALLVALLASGCFRLVPPAPPSAPAAPALSAEEAARIVARRESDTRTLTALFQIAIHRPDGSVESTRGALVVARPDRLRLQIFSFGVMTAYDFTANGDRYRVRRPLEGVDRRGRFTDLAPGDPMSAALDLRPLFLGAPQPDSPRVVERDGVYVVAAGDGAVRHEFEVSKRDGRVVADTIYSDGQRRIAVRFADQRLVDGAPMPFEIHVEYPESGVALDIRMIRYTRNQPVDPALFER